MYAVEICDRSKVTQSVFADDKNISWNFMFCKLCSQIACSMYGINASIRIAQ